MDLQTIKGDKHAKKNLAHFLNKHIGLGCIVDNFRRFWMKNFTRSLVGNVPNLLHTLLHTRTDVLCSSKVLFTEYNYWSEMHEKPILIQKFEKKNCSFATSTVSMAFIQFTL